MREQGWYWVRLYEGHPELKTDTMQGVIMAYYDPRPNSHGYAPLWTVGPYGGCNWGEQNFDWISDRIIPPEAPAR